MVPFFTVHDNKSAIAKPGMLVLEYESMHQPQAGPGEDDYVLLFSSLEGST